MAPIDELPPPITIAAEPLTYASESTAAGNVLRYHREYRIDRFLVPLESLPKLSAGFAKILADERGSAVLKAP